MPDVLLSAASIRELASRLGVRPTKTLGQNFVIDPNTVRRIARVAQVEGQHVLEVGPGLGSLTLALLPVAASVTAVEIDPPLAAALPETIAALAPELSSRLTVIQADALALTELPTAPQALVANLPYNVAVPVVLTLLSRFPSLESVLVMVQLEVAERLAAGPGSRVYGSPSAKAAWYGEVSLAGRVGRNVFWPAPNVDSGLVRLRRTSPPRTDVSREAVFAVVDAAFAQRRKVLRGALAGWAGSPSAAEEILVRAGVAPTARGEQLSIEAFARIAAARSIP